jgi:glucosamine--fructose-6-phosphate aminotransferase (isomerizing)
MSLMCGIIACRTHAPAIDYLLVALRRLEYRGYDSVGVAVRTAVGDVVRLRTAERIDALDRLIDARAGVTWDGAGIGHTRWATHGSATEANAHPHIDCSGRISLVHNGILENADMLRRALAESGHHFASSVDSEVLCHLIEEHLEISGDLVDAVRAALVPVDGSWAIAVLDEHTGKIVVAAHRSPLLVAHTAQGSFATSDVAAVADWVEEFRVLEDGDVVELTEGGVGAGVEVGSDAVMASCRWSGGEIELNGYADYMAKEIDEQPEAAARVLDQLGSGIADGTLWRDLGVAPFERMQVVGCGTSLNAGRVLANVARRLGGLPVTVTIASEAAEELVEPATLCLAISQSGETADVLRALDTSGCGHPVVALTNNAHSTLARRADAFLGCAAGPEIGVAATKTFVCQVIAGTALLISALVATDRMSPARSAALVDELRRLPDELAAAGTAAKWLVPPIVDAVAASPGFVFLARGAGLPYAAEGALKLKELTYCWAECYPAGELKHGPLALIGQDVPVIVVDSGDPKLAANVAEVQARGGRVISIGPDGSTVPVLGDVAAPWGPLESVVPMQILARTLAVALGRDVDKPRNLAKSVTVE